MQTNQECHLMHTNQECLIKTIKFKFPMYIMLRVYYTLLPDIHVTFPMYIDV